MKKTKDTEYHLCDDGTMVEKSDWEWLQAHMKKSKKKKKKVVDGYYYPGYGKLKTLYKEDK